MAVASVAFGLGSAGSAVAIPISTLSSSSTTATGASARIGDRLEAWYAEPSGAACLPFVGCLPIPLPLPSAFPAGTLHVGATLGVESARAYVVPDLPAADSKSFPTSGTLVLPVDSDPLAGTLDAGSAHIRVCLTTGALPAHASASAVTTGTPPTVDCKVKAPASYSVEGKYFFADLRPFLRKWAHGTPQRGVALVPNTDGASKLVNWHIALAGKGSTGRTVHSLVRFAACRACAPPQPATSSSPAASQPPPAPGPTDIVPPGVVTEPAPVTAPQIAPSATAAVYLVRAKGFRYPAIFIAPLAILAGVIFFSRLFTGSTVRPRRMTMGADRSNG